MTEPTRDVNFPALNRMMSPFFELRRQAGDLREAIRACWDQLTTEHPAWKTQDDARLTCFESLWNITRYGELSLHYLGFYMGSPEYWSHFAGPAPSLGWMDYEMTAYTQCGEIAVFHLYFAAIENSHRSFHGALNPGASAIPASYKDVYYSLLSPQRGFGQSDLDLLDLLRHIRNTLHNEGVHRNAPQLVTYKGVEYPFAKGKPLAFVKWQFVLDRAAELVALQERIVRFLGQTDYIPNATVERFHTDALPTTRCT